MKMSSKYKINYYINYICILITIKQLRLDSFHLTVDAMLTHLHKIKIYQQILNNLKQFPPTISITMSSKHKTNNLIHYFNILISIYI